MWKARLLEGVVEGTKPAVLEEIYVNLYSELE
jgi:hypothetical protein